MSFPFGSGSAFQRVNLARRPFSNSRPRRRLSTALWSLAIIATLWNLFLFAQYWRGSSNGREDLRAVRAQIDERVASVRAMQSELGDADLSSQNQHVRFLNRKIAERTFPWSRLFDDLATVLPRNVRLDSLAPSIPEEKGRRRQKITPSIEWISLGVAGTAKTSEDILELLDGMFSSPAFASPVLANERDDEGQVDFDLSVRYRIHRTSDTDLTSQDESLLMTDAQATDSESEPSAATSAVEGEVATASTVSPGGAAVESAGAVEEGLPSSQSTTNPSTTSQGQASVAASSAAARRSTSAEPETPERSRPTARPSRSPSTSSRPTPAGSERDDTPVRDRNPANGRDLRGGVAIRQPVVQPSSAPQTQPETAAPSQPTAPGTDPRRGQRRVVDDSDLPPGTRETADDRFGRDRDVAPRVDNASRGGG